MCRVDWGRRRSSSALALTGRQARSPSWHINRRLLVVNTDQRHHAERLPACISNLHPPTHTHTPRCLFIKFFSRGVGEDSLAHISGGTGVITVISGVGSSISGEPWWVNGGGGGGGRWRGRDGGHLFFERKRKKIHTKKCWGSKKIDASLLHLISVKGPNLSSPSPPLPTFGASDRGLVYHPTFSFISGPQRSPPPASTAQLLSSSAPQGSRLISVIFA